MKDDVNDFVKGALDRRRSVNQYRQLNNVIPVFGTSKIEVDGKEFINFSSNDYLGLRHHPKVVESSKEYINKFGAGSGASRLVTGTFNIHSELEDKLAKTFETEVALLFNSGFQANISILSAVADRNSLIIADKMIHSSLIQGALLSRAELKRYNHNDYEHLEQLLTNAQTKDYNRIWVVSETVFSMDGDVSNIDIIIELCEKYNALYYSDDAHALGVLGDQGLGLNFRKSGIDLLLGTFGKSFGSFGAFVACSQQMKEYLINFSGGFIYSTALPPSVIGSINAALDLIPKMEKERYEFIKKCDYLRRELKTLGFDTLNSSSQIIPVVIGDENDTLNLSNELKRNGCWVSAIRPPTVENGASRLRITLSVQHTYNEIDVLLEVLNKW